MSDNPTSSSYPQYGGVEFNTPINAEPETYWPAAMKAVERAYKHINKKLTEEQQWREVERLIKAGEYAQRCYALAQGKTLDVEIEIEEAPVEVIVEADKASLNWFLSDEYLAEQEFLKQERDVDD